MLNKIICLHLSTIPETLLLLLCMYIHIIYMGVHSLVFNVLLVLHMSFLCQYSIILMQPSSSRQLFTPPSLKEWDSEKGKFVFFSSPLSTYVCWKCSKVGNLPSDCTVAVKDGGGRKAQRETVSAWLTTCCSLLWNGSTYLIYSNGLYYLMYSIVYIYRCFTVNAHLMQKLTTFTRKFYS